MKLNIDNLRKTISSDMDSKSNNANNSENQYKLVYPFNEGKYTVRILYNAKAQVVQRKILRHATADKKTKVPCLAPYGEDCPVCSAIKEAEQVRGEDCGAFRKYGYTTRGICYAQMVEAPAEVFKDGSVKRGDIIMLMYPKTVFNAINNIMIESGEQLGEIVSENLGHPIVLDVQSVNGKKQYSAQIALKKQQVCDTDDQFDALLNNLPNINEQFVPLYPDDEIRKSAKALAESIKSEYINNTVIDPGIPTKVYGEEIKYTQADTVPTTEATQTVPEIVDNDDVPFVVNDTVTEAKPEVSESVGGDCPDCFGCYNSGDKKCMLCIKELECMKATK